MTVRILQGDCRAILPTLPAESVHCVVTSPPYLGLRDYGVTGQIGLEGSMAEFIAGMVAVFREVRRVLRKDGTCWLNMGDSYAGSWGAQGRRETSSDDPSWHASQIKNHPKRARNTGSIRDAGLKPKDLMMVPARLAIALQDDGWWLRKDIIWAKPNPMPESATDRPTSSHEHVFLLTKSARYFYDGDAVREGRTVDEDEGGSNRKVVGAKRVKVPGGWDQGEGGHGTIHRDGRTEATYQAADIKAGRNLRDVWTIPSQPFPDAHFATFPPKLVEPCILAGTSAGGCCPACGGPWTRVVDRGEQDAAWVKSAGANRDGTYHGEAQKDYKRTSGWRPTCDCPDHAPVPCTVLDPFAGAGTTGLVADRLGRGAVLIELSEEYVGIAQRRLEAETPLFGNVERAAPEPEMDDLFGVAAE